MACVDIYARENAGFTTVISRWVAILRPWLPWGCLLLVAAAEILIAFLSPQLGLVLHALLLLGLTLYGGLGRHTDARRLALALTLAPLIRLLSLSLPLANVPRLAWYPAVSLPLLLATVMLIRQLRIAPAALGLRPGNFPLQLMLMGGGLGLGALEYFILAPAQLITTFSWTSVWLSTLSLIIFTGFMEELIFRGLLQAAAPPVLGRWALVYVSLLFAALHIGHLSALEVALAFGVGLVFAQVAQNNGSILGISLAHGLTNVMLFLIMPYLAQHPTDAVADIASEVIGGGTAMAFIATIVLMLSPIASPATVTPAISRRASIRELRRRSGLTYVDLAQRTGIPSRLLAEIEHGLRLPAPEQLRLIAAGLGVAPQLLSLSSVDLTDASVMP